MLPPIYIQTAGLQSPAQTVIEHSADAGGHEVRAHVRAAEALALADALAAVAERTNDFRRTFHGHDAGGRPWHVVLNVWS